MLEVEALYTQTCICTVLEEQEKPSSSVSLVTNCIPVSMLEKQEELPTRVAVIECNN